MIDTLLGIQFVERSQFSWYARLHLIYLLNIDLLYYIEQKTNTNLSIINGKFIDPPGIVSLCALADLQVHLDRCIAVAVLSEPDLTHHTVLRDLC